MVLAKLESEGAKDSELKARQRQVEKEVGSIRDHADAEAELAKRAVQVPGCRYQATCDASPSSI